MRQRLAIALVLLSAAVAGLGLSAWVARPYHQRESLLPPLEPYKAKTLPPTYSKDAASLIMAFRGQAFRSFCGPASIATVMRAYGDQNADQQTVFTSWLWKVKTFYSGITLRELSDLAMRAGLTTSVVYADSLSAESFKALVNKNLATAGDYVVVNFDRRELGESGIGHFSPIASYDSERDAYLLLDEADYKYPFTWVPAELLFKAAHTRDGGHYRGLLLITGYQLAK